MNENAFIVFIFCKQYNCLSYLGHLSEIHVIRTYNFYVGIANIMPMRLANGQNPNRFDWIYTNDKKITDMGEYCQMYFFFCLNILYCIYIIFNIYKRFEHKFGQLLTPYKNQLIQLY